MLRPIWIPGQEEIIAALIQEQLKDSERKVGKTIRLCSDVDLNGKR